MAQLHWLAILMETEMTGGAVAYVETPVIGLNTFEF